MSINVDFVGRRLPTKSTESRKARTARCAVLAKFCSGVRSRIDDYASHAVGFYSIAISSATESAAMFDVCLRRKLRRKLIAGETHERGKQLLERIVAMLIKLCRALRDN